LLKLYRWPSDDWQKIGAEMPSEIIWADLLNATAEEKQFVERLLGIRVPSEDSLSEIEASSRLILDNGTLYLSSPAVRLNEDSEAEITPVGFVIGPRVLVTVRFAQLPIFDDIGKRIGSDDSLENGMCVFTSLVEAMVDRGADVLEHLGAEVDRLSRGVFKGGLVRTKRPVRSSRRMREALENIGELADRLAKARDVLLGVGRVASFAGDVGVNGSPPPRRSASKPSPRMSLRSAITRHDCRTRSSFCSMPCSASSTSSRTSCSRS